MFTLRDWFALKVSGDSLRLGQASFATEEWRRFAGREHYAKVSLRAEPASEFEFFSEAGAWSSQESKDEFECYVLVGVVAELLGQGPGTPILGLRIAVTATVVDDEASNGNAFFMAARAATEALLRGPDGEHHGNWRRGDA